MKPRYWSRIAIFAYPTCIRHERDRRTPHEGTDRAYPSAKSVGKPINRKSILTRNFSFGSKVKEIGLARGNAIYVTRTLARWRFIFFLFFWGRLPDPMAMQGIPLHHPSLSILLQSSAIFLRDLLQKGGRSAPDHVCRSG